MVNAMNFQQPIIVGSLSADPSSPNNGAVYYNTTLNALRSFQNGTWSTLSTGSVSLTGQPLNNHLIIVGNGSNLSASVDTSGVGQITADATAGLTINALSITNGMISASAAIALTKLAALTNNTAVATNSSGFMVSSSTTNTELGYVHGVTSAIQTQLTGKANTALSNLASTALNVDLLPGSDASINLGGASFRYLTAYIENLNAGAAVLSLNGSSINANSLRITNVATPTTGTDAANMAYVQSTLQGLEGKASVAAATTAALAANTYSNGSSGVGATLTGNSNGALASIDGQTPTVGLRYLIKNEVTGANNGIYSLTQLGDVSNPYILTRTLDADTCQPASNPSVTSGIYTFVENGTVNQRQGWFLTTADPITLGTTSLTFSQFFAAGEYIFGNGLNLSGSTVTVLAADSSITVGAGGVAVGVDAAGAIITGGSGIKVQLETSNPTLQIASNKLGVKLDAARAITAGASGIGVNVDNATLDINGSDQVEVKALGIANAHIAAAAAIALSKLAALSVDRIPSTDHTTGFLTDSDASNDKTLISNSLKRGTSASAIVTEQYIDATTLTDNQSSPATAFSFALASFLAVEITYLIKTGAGTPDTRIGTIRVSSNSSGSNLSFVDTFVESADCGVTWSVVLSSGIINIQYVSTSQSSNRTMRADAKYFRV